MGHTDTYEFTGFFIDSELYGYKYSAVWAPEGEEPRTTLSTHPPSGISVRYYPDARKYKDARVTMVQMFFKGILNINRFIGAQVVHPLCINHIGPDDIVSEGTAEILKSKEWELIPIEYRIGPPGEPNVGTWVPSWDTEDRILEYPDEVRKLRGGKANE